MISSACECSSLELIDYIYIKLEEYYDCVLEHVCHLQVLYTADSSTALTHADQKRGETK